MLLASLLLMWQTETRATQPTYFLPVVVIFLVAGILGWLIAAVLGFQRARAFGPSTRWFAFAAVCLIIYHIQWLLLAFAVYSDADTALSVGAFFNVFVVVAGFCAIMGFVKLTSPE